MSIQIRAEHVVKTFEKDNTVIPDLSLVIREGELFTLLGPSGCGKTTFLRMIAGFYPLDGGHLYFSDRCVENVPAYARNIGMVFQNYAIFPHLTAAQNVEYGLKQRKISKADRAKRVADILEVVRMKDFADRLPSKLSGGQQQRIALARAIVIQPDVLLMDEPLSNLDAKLRVEMRGTIREIQRRVGITTVYVTHDQEEALAISDRIAVIDHGVIQQIAAPKEIYQRPSNVFVATFIGFSNLLRGVVRVENGVPSVVAGGCALRVERLDSSVKDGQDVILSMRPDEFDVDPRGIPCTVTTSTFLGQNINYGIAFDGDTAVPTEDGNQLVQAVRHTQRFFESGESIRIMPDTAKINVFTGDGLKNLLREG